MARFPSLLIERHGLTPQGSFAEAQAAYLRPDAAAVAELDRLLAATNTGVVAHFYMDPELQGVLAACTWPHRHVADSLVMADRAVAMAKAGVAAICVAGVDFMSENVRAVLDEAGFAHVAVYRLAMAKIGCSLAESAEAPAYAAYLRKAQSCERALHVIYINTSLRVKALSNQMVPTITCTSSNVVKTILQASAQIPDLHIWFGPDTYMGDNLAHLLTKYAQIPLADVQLLHPQHTPQTVAQLAEHFHFFAQGNCVVHHLFGAAVVRTIREEYPNALYAAHLEVPGEMFALAAEAALTGRGVVGSTSDILRFIGARLEQALRSEACDQTLQFVLGTEAGMITSIVAAVEAQLATALRSDVRVEIVFPVAAEAIVPVADSSLGIVPGVAAGEGCSVAGGCATCPYMRMNNLEGLFSILSKIQRASADLPLYRPHLEHQLIDGRSVAELGAIPILQMRSFQQNGELSSELVSDIVSRRA